MKVFMHTFSRMSKIIFPAAAAAVVVLGALAAPQTVFAQAVATAAAQTQPPIRIRGTVVFADQNTLVIKDRSGEVVSLARSAGMPVSEVYLIKLSDIKKGSFIGTAAVPQADGTEKALEVLVFPEAARGTGEGHYPWDLQPSSTMTNATVADMGAAPTSVRGGQRLHLTYQGGEKMVNVPRGTPVVTFRPGTEALLVAGAKVLVNAQDKNGTPTALRVLAGRDGFTPPM